jgi:hypothetical protein
MDFSGLSIPVKNVKDKKSDKTLEKKYATSFGLRYKEYGSTFSFSVTKITISNIFDSN